MRHYLGITLAKPKGARAMTDTERRRRRARARTALVVALWDLGLAGLSQLVLAVVVRRLGGG
jgi:hypothetical protein